MSSVPDIMQSDAARWIIGLAVTAAVAAAGHRTNSLTTGGALSATAIGGVIVGAGGWWTGLLLVAFFVSSSALSRTRAGEGPRFDQVRGNRRDAIQVFANGGIPSICALVGFSISQPEPWLMAAAAAIAGATSDTWATEIGRRGGSVPRSVISGKHLPAGTSGAISAIGTFGSIAGSLLIATVAAGGSALDAWIDASAVAVFVAVGMSGVAGSFLDSVLGATLQGLWRCPACNILTESTIHRCGTATRLERGYSFMDNDLVNAVSITGAGLVGLLLSLLWT